MAARREQRGNERRRHSLRQNAGTGRRPRIQGTRHNPAPMYRVRVCERKAHVAYGTGDLNGVYGVEFPTQITRGNSGAIYL